MKRKKTEKQKRFFSNINIFLMEEMMLSYLSKTICSMIIEAKEKATEGKGSKMLTPEQMF